MPRPQRKDPDAFQGWKMVETDGMETLYNQSFKALKEVTVDFGEHLTGYFSFTIGNRTPTPTLRCEVPPDVRRGARRTEYPIRSLSGRSEPRMAARRSGHRDARAGDGHAAPAVWPSVM